MAELLAFPAACAGAKAANKVVKEVTGKSPYKHCRSAVKGLRNIVLGRVEDEVGERLSEEIQELFSQEERAVFERRLGSLDNLLDSVANNPAADDPSVTRELVDLKTVLDTAIAAKNAQGRADALTAISDQMISLILALSNAAPRYIAEILRNFDAGIREKIQALKKPETTVANRYEFVSPKNKAFIGAGSFAKTWKMKKGGRIYAVKHTDILSAGVEKELADLERELAEARKNRDGTKCKELKVIIGLIKAIAPEIRKLEVAEAAAFGDDDFDEGDRLHGELEARRGEVRALIRGKHFEPSKLAHVRTLEGHSKDVRCGVHIL